MGRLTSCTFAIRLPVSYAPPAIVALDSLKKPRGLNGRVLSVEPRAMGRTSNQRALWWRPKRRRTRDLLASIQPAPAEGGALMAGAKENAWKFWRKVASGDPLDGTAQNGLCGLRAIFPDARVSTGCREKARAGDAQALFCLCVPHLANWRQAAGLMGPGGVAWI
jgi:hypothetical protein